MDVLRELIAQQRAQPIGDEGWAVLQDAVLAEGGPHSRLINVPPGRLGPELQAVANDLFGRRGRAGGSTLTLREDPDDAKSTGLLLTFDKGFVHTLRVEIREPPTDPDHWLLSTLGRVLREPVGQLTFSIDLDVGYGGALGAHHLLDVLIREAPIAARMIVLQHVLAGGRPGRQEVQWSPMWTAAPYLEWLTLDSSAVTVGEAKHERLRSLRLAGLSAESLRAVATAEVPALKALDIRFGPGDDADDYAPQDMQALLTRSFDRLRVARLQSCRFMYQLLADVLRAPWVAALQTLDLSGSYLGDPGGAVLLAQVERLRHLQRLDLSRCAVPRDTLTRLDALLSGVVVGIPPPADDREDEDEEYDYDEITE